MSNCEPPAMMMLINIMSSTIGTLLGILIIKNVETWFNKQCCEYDESKDDNDESSEEDSDEDSEDGSEDISEDNSEDRSEEGQEKIKKQKNTDDKLIKMVKTTTIEELNNILFNCTTIINNNTEFDQVTLKKVNDIMLECGKIATYHNLELDKITIKELNDIISNCEKIITNEVDPDNNVNDNINDALDPEDNDIES